MPEPLDKPADDQIEINVFGPGLGECVVVHLGSNRWMVVDSCVSAGRPIALTYLERLGVDPATDVVLVLVTHWHDDHIRGISEVIGACSSAPIAVPQALLVDNEFGAVIRAFQRARLGSFTSGLKEIDSAFQAILSNTRTEKWVVEDRIIYEAPANKLAHGQPVQVRALSPADGQVSAMIAQLGREFPKHATTMYRAPTYGRNDVSAAAWLTVGSEIVALLGADVETTTNKALGWDKIVAIRAGAVPPKATAFKIPHHGSITGHNDDVWSKLLEKDAICVITPWQLGSGLLPKHDDIVRIKTYSANVFVTSPGTLMKAKKRRAAVDRTIRDGGYELTSIEGKMGHVRLRARPGEAWMVELYEVATKM